MAGNLESEPLMLCGPEQVASPLWALLCSFKWSQECFLPFLFHWVFFLLL